MESDSSQPPEATQATIGILDLPADIFHEIFSHFGEPGTPNLPWRLLRRDITWKLRKTLSSLRLTCRVFNQMATPFMLTIVDVVPDQASLDRIEAISRRPFLAKNVRGVCLGLSYYTDDLSLELSDFSNYRLEDLKQLADFQGSELYTDLNGYEKPIFESIRRAWKEEVRPSELSLGGENKGTGMSAEYRRVLREGFVKYQRGYEETRSLVQSGSFVRQLAASISRLPHFNTLLFRLSIGRGEIWYGHKTHGRGSLEGIAAVVSSPFTEARDDWGEPTFETATAQVIVDLPLAIRIAGATLRHVMVDGIPITSVGTASRLPSSFMLTGSIGDDLKMAFENLESVYLHNLGRPHCGSPVWGQIMAEYLKAVVSGPLITSVSLEGLFCSAGDAGENDWRFELGPVFSSITSQHLRRFHASAASVSQRELEDFFSRFCGRRLSFRLFGTDMSGGSWEEVFRFLRRKVKEENWDCDISLYMVTEKGWSVEGEFRLRGGS